MDVLGIVGVAAGSVAIPLAAVSIATAVTGISQGVSASQNGGASEQAADPKDDPRLAKFSLRVSCEVNSPARKEVHGKIVVLRNRKVCLH